jgi:hypothetical protein
MEGSREQGNEPVDSVKCWVILEYLRNWRLLKKGSAPWSSFSYSFSTTELSLI